MWKQHLLWQTDGRGKLVAEAGGYLITVERLLPRLEAQFIIACPRGGGGTAISAIRSTTKGAIAAAEQTLAKLPALVGHRSEVLLQAEMITSPIGIDARHRTKPGAVCHLNLTTSPSKMT